MVFGKPEQRLVPASGVPEREQTTGQFVVRQHRSHFGLGGSHIRIEDCGTECAASVAADQSVQAPCLPVVPGLAHMIWTEYRGSRGRLLGEAVPNSGCINWRYKWIEQPPFATRVYADAGHYLLPVHVGLPCGVLEPPDPKAWCEIDDFYVRRHFAWMIARSGGT